MFSIIFAAFPRISSSLSLDIGVTPNIVLGDLNVNIDIKRTEIHHSEFLDPNSFAVFSANESCARGVRTQIPRTEKIVRKSLLCRGQKGK